MSQKVWWDAYPGRLEEELRCLDEAGILYTRDESAWAKGVLRLDLSMQCGEETVRLRATYPELYPIFRVEVEAADLHLDHHQNPFGKNLCLMGRSTDLWHTNVTLASLLTDKLPIVLKTGRSHDISEVTRLEEHQAEPFADYFTYPPGASVVVAGNFEIPLDITSGTLLLVLCHASRFG